jgi:acetaldehyde dehydrogenase (acetylating)
MAEYDRDLQSIQAARRLAVACREAQRAFAASSQEQVDRVCAAMAEAGFAAAERLGRLAAAETGFGVAEHKRFKDEFATKVLWESIKDTPTVGVINRDDARRVVEIGWPLGVVVGLTPSTNPTSTAMY